MTGRQRTRITLPGALAGVLLLAGCDANPAGLPFQTVGRDMAGIYLSQAEAANLDMRIALGTRFSVSGIYKKSTGENVRFSGSWERQGDRLVMTLSPQPGIPSEITLDISREETLTEIPVDTSRLGGGDPDAPPQFVRRRVVRLTGGVTVEGQTLQLDLVRVITDVTGGGSGQQAN